jgi:rod shape determining protein RodA
MALVMAAHYAKIPIAEMTRPKNLWQPALAIIVPVALVLGQPDLGTAVKVAMIGIAMAFVAGVSWWLFITCAGILGAALPLIWQYGLHDYQRRRVLTFMDPEADPLGSGYHVMQSKIALGSAGLDGKGFLHGSQSHLEFLPEAHTDFVFSMLAEEWGFLGGVVILSLYFIIFVYSVLIAHRARNTFGRLLAFGLGMNLMFYVMINVGMVMGLLPVVGIPLPLISHGGTVMLSTFFALGLMMSVSVHRDVKLSFW